MSERPTSSAIPQQVVIGAAIAAMFWAISGIAALFSPTGDASELGSVSFYIIEGTHAVAETGVLIALLGLWPAGPWSRSTRAAFIVAIVATALLALLTYLTVVLMAAGFSPEATGDIASLFFLASLLGTLIGFVWLGIALARSRMVPALLGWLLAAYPLGIAALLSVYPMGIALGLLWAAVAWVATQSSRRAEPLG
ncbi:MAG: hypothetical protein ACR2I5_10300 [Candidatus Limnocylindria bacterium]